MYPYKPKVIGSCTNHICFKLIMIGKLYLWDCRRSQILPNIYGFKKKIAVKYETEKYISLHSKKTKDFFEAKWIVSPLVNA